MCAPAFFFDLQELGFPSGLYVRALTSPGICSMTLTTPLGAERRKRRGRKTGRDQGIMTRNAKEIVVGLVTRNVIECVKGTGTKRGKETETETETGNGIVLTRIGQTEVTEKSVVGTNQKTLNVATAVTVRGARSAIWMS